MSGFEEEITATPTALQIVSTGEGEAETANDFILNEANIEAIISKIPSGSKVAVLSIVGAFRTGKSFLLNFILRFLRHGKYGELSEDWMTAEGGDMLDGNGNEIINNTLDSTDLKGSFVWKGGQKRQTTGMWMWSEPFMKQCEQTGEEIAILLMDTQGMFDNETTMTLTAQIFGLSTMISSFQIYNVQNRIQEDNLQHLALFSEYGRLALCPQHKESAKTLKQTKTDDDAAIKIKQRKENENELTKEDDLNVAPEEQDDDDDDIILQSSSGKPFQRLQFLVRDSPEVDDFDHTASTEVQTSQYAALRSSMSMYFKDVIRDRGVADLQSTRDQIIRCFEQVNCFLLPHPGPEVTRKSYNGKVSAIDPVFRALLNRYIRSVFEHEIEPKVINKRSITGPELLNYFKAYCTMFKAGQGTFPKAMTMLEATAEANNRNAYDLAICSYKNEMTDIVGPKKTFMKESDLIQLEKNLQKISIEIFTGIANMGSVGHIKKYKSKLREDMKTERIRFFESNSLKNPFREIEMYAIPIVIASVSWLLSRILAYTCNHHICHTTGKGLQSLYMFIILAFLVLTWKNITGMFQYLKDMILLIQQAQGSRSTNEGFASFSMSSVKNPLQKKSE